KRARGGAQLSGDALRGLEYQPVGREVSVAESAHRRLHARQRLLAILKLWLLSAIVLAALRRVVHSVPASVLPHECGQNLARLIEEVFRILGRERIERQRASEPCLLLLLSQRPRRLVELRQPVLAGAKLIIRAPLARADAELSDGEHERC